MANIALIGVRGYGRIYLEQVKALSADGSARLTGACDIDPAAARDLPPGVVFRTDHRALLQDCEADVVVVATPPHTHFDIATAALDAGCDVMLEKPPVTSVAQHAALVEKCRSRGRLCQVGFQGMVGAPMRRLLDLVSSGSLGEITEIVVTAQWIRLDSYYQRSPWAGKRVSEGIVIADGAITNPLAHPVMNALAVAQAADPETEPVRMEVEAYRCRDIATDDTVSARLQLSNGKRIHIAVTLCAETHVDPIVEVLGTKARATLEASGMALSVDGVRLDLPADRGQPLANLLAHRQDPDRVPLYVPLRSTAAFTAVLAGMLSSPIPHRVPAEFLDERAEDSSRRVVLRGINDAVQEAGRRRALFSELGVAWARGQQPITLSAEPAPAS